MGTSSKLNAALASLFFAASLLNYIKTDDLSNPDTSIPPSLLDTSLTPSTSDTLPKIKSITTLMFSNPVLRYLKPELFSQSDPLAYLLSIVTRNMYNGIIIDPIMALHLKTTMESLCKHVQNSLISQKLPQPYVRYARLLYSIASCLAKLNRVSIEIRRFQMEYPNESEYPSPPSGISNPELRTLFDADIFSDPGIPSVLVQKLVKISNDKIPDMVENLARLLKTHNFVKQPYYAYMVFLKLFLDDTKELESLREKYLKFQTRQLNKLE